MIEEKQKTAKKLGSKFLELFNDEIKNENKYSFLLFIDYEDAYYKKGVSNFVTELEVISKEFADLLERIDKAELLNNFNHHYCLEKVSNTLEIIKNKLKQSLEKKGIND